MEKIFLGFGAPIFAILVGYLAISVIGYYVHRAELKDIKLLLHEHSGNFKRVVWRDECQKDRGTCSKHTDERHMEVIRRIDRLENAFKNCMDNLVEALSKDRE